MTRYTHTNKTDGQTLSAAEWNNIGNALAALQIAPGIVVASANSPAWMRASADYLCDGTADDVQWQAAIDAADAAAGASTIQAVYLCPGDYHLSSGVNWKATNLIGLGGGNVAHAVRVFWAGASNATVITKAAGTVDTGGGGAGLMEAISFRGKSGANYPGTWIDGSVDQWDNFLRLREVQFGDCLGTQLKIGQWYNCHLYDMRFDAFGRGGSGAAIELNTGSTTTPNLSSFLLEGFTVDWGNTTGGVGPEAIFIIRNNDQNNMGPVVIRDGRIEGGSHSTTMSGNKAVIQIKHDPSVSSTYNSRTIGLRLENLAIFNESTENTHTVISRTTPETPLNTNEHFSLVNTFIQVGKYTNFQGGSWPTSYAVGTIPLKSYYPDDHYGHSMTTSTAGQPTFENLRILKGLRLYTKAGAPADGDFIGTANDGLIAVDTTNNRLYVRSAGTWKYAALT